MHATKKVISIKQVSRNLNTAEARNKVIKEQGIMQAKTKISSLQEGSTGGQPSLRMQATKKVLKQASLGISGNESKQQERQKPSRKITRMYATK